MSRALDLRPRRQKYNAKRTLYKGEWYDSKREAAHAQLLDTLVRVGEILRWSRPPAIGLEVNGVLVCSYRPDFAILYADGSQEYHEVKGRIAAHSRIKMALFRALYPGTALRIIK